jgi:glucoside 3-dehydrogenase (cytochrome c) hitch-hiker subunit
MHRRAAIRRLGMLLGASLSAPTASAVLSGCKAPPPPYRPRALDPDAFLLMGQLAETILPETETAGARTAGVDRFVDTLLADFYPAREAEAFRVALGEFGSPLRGEDGYPDPGRVARADRAAYALDPSPRPEGEPFDRHQFFRRLKELVITGYYTSEAAELKPNPMGTYRADVPMTEIGRSWS